MASIFDLAGVSLAFGVAALLGGVSTVALAAPDPQPDPRDARIQQLEAQVQRLLADHRRLPGRGASS